MGFDLAYHIVENEHLFHILIRTSSRFSTGKKGEKSQQKIHFFIVLNQDIPLEKWMSSTDNLLLLF